MTGGHRLLGSEGQKLIWPRCSVVCTRQDGVKGVGLSECFFVENYGPSVEKVFGKKAKAKL